MTKKVRVTIKDVAKVANVTPQTVSRAFRGTHDISEETKNRILKIAAEMGYVRNSSAISLRSGGSNLIAVIYDNLMNSYFSIMVHFLQRCLKEKGYSVIAISVMDAYFNESAYLSALEHNVDGIITFLQPGKEIPRLIENYHVPVLLMGRTTEEKDIDCIYLDDITVGRLAAKKLIADGVKNPLYVSEALELTCAYDRYLGFNQEFESLGIKPLSIVNKIGKSLMLEPELTSVFEKNEPDGIFCFNDMLAFETLYVIEKNSFNLPKVIGVDNIQQEIYFPRRLTTVGWDKMQLAKKATDIILDRIKRGIGEGVRVMEKVFLVEGVTG